MSDAVWKTMRGHFEHIARPDSTQLNSPVGKNSGKVLPQYFEGLAGKITSSLHESNFACYNCINGITSTAYQYNLTYYNCISNVTICGRTVEEDYPASFLSAVKFSTCSELHDWQQTSDVFVELSWVPVITSLDPTQLNSTVQSSRVWRCNHVFTHSGVSTRKRDTDLYRRCRRCEQPITVRRTLLRAFCE